MINRIRLAFATAAVCGLLFSAAGSAQAAPKDYQFTGPIAAVTDTGFSVTKGKEIWEFAKDADTKLPEGAKVGDKVTVHYVMHATMVEASAAAAKAPAAKEKAPAKEKATKGKKADAAPATTDASKPAAPTATP